MRLSAGSLLGAYRIEKFLTSGGMGEVYLASHEQLGRRVAIKVLAGTIAGDPVAVQRFRREARAASTLSHPHICTLYDFCQHEGVSYLVLEYLEGTTLESCLKKRSLTMSEATRIAAEVADALDHAHSRGFVHRDLKPGNIILTEEHGAKVLDFGLVARTPIRFAGSAADGREAVTADLTVEGTLVGTLPYMSPEQIEGGDVDARTDIYALGAILYEMITGRRPFEGRSALELAVAIVHADVVPIGNREPETPDLLVRLIERCMARNPEDRWQSARDIAAQLRWLPAMGHRSARHRRTRGFKFDRFGLIGGVMIGIVAIMAVSILLQARTPGGGAEMSAGLTAFGVTAAPGVTFTESARSIPDLSPDGTRLLFVGTDGTGTTRVYVRELDEFQPAVIPRTEDAMLPFWAPDGRSIGYFARENLMVLRADGAPPVARAPVTLEARGASWSSDNVLIYSPAPRTGVFAVRVDGGEPRQITVPDTARGEIGHLWPQFLPDGEHFLYFVSSVVDSTRGVYVGSLDGGIRRRLLGTASRATFGSDHVLYVQGTALLAQPFDTRRLQLTGPARMLDEHVLTTHTFAAGFSVSGNGSLAYWSGDAKDITRLLWLDPGGQPRDTVGEPAHQRNPSLSPDGRYLAREEYTETDGDIAVTDLVTGRTSRRTTPLTQEKNPVWSPDGKSYAFVAEGATGWAIYRAELDAARPPQLLLESDTDVMTTDWAPDGSALLYANRDASGDYDVFTLPLVPGGRPRPALARPVPERVWLVEEPSSDTHEVSGRFSPSGRWIAYGSNESGRVEIYAQPYPVTGLRCQISDGGGYDPHWGATDEEIYYLSRAGVLMSVRLGTSGQCPTEAPRRLFKTPIETPGAARNHYAFSSSAGAFLFNAPASDPATWTINVIQNWPARLSGPDQ